MHMYNRNNMTTSCQCTETTSDHNTQWSLGNETNRLYCALGPVPSYTIIHYIDGLYIHTRA